MTINKAHMACLKGDFSACWAIRDAMNILSEAAAFTQNTKAGKHRDLLSNNPQNALKPLLAAYSTASQRVGRHEKDEIFRSWMKEAIFQTLIIRLPKKEPETEI